MPQSLSHQFTQSPSSVGSGTTSVSVRLRITYNSTEGVSDSSNNFTVSGSWPSRSNANVNISIPFGGGSQVIYDETITVSTSRANTVSRSFSASFSGIEYWGAGQTIRTSGTHTVPIRPPAPPSKCATPTNSNITSGSWRSNLGSAPANNGAAIIEYQFQRADNSSFTSGVASATTTSRNYTFSGVSINPNSTYYHRVRARNSAGWGEWSNGRAVTTAVASPTSPNNVSVAQTNATRHTVSWNRRNTAGAPYDSQRVQRNTDDGSWSGWQTIATVGGGVTSYVDTGTRANREYRWRIVAVNAGGTGTSDPSDYIRTTPAAPTNIQAVLRSGDIIVTGTGNSPAGQSAASFRNEYQTRLDGGTWTSVGSPTTAHDPSLTVPSVNPAVTHQYRVRASVASGTAANTTLYSPWSAPSNVVQLQAPPNAPTLLEPVSTVRDRAQVVTFTWRHNPVDTTEQTAAQIRIYHVNSTTQFDTYTVATPEQYSRILVQESGQVRWQVRTRGEHATYGPWSSIGMFTLAAQPTVAVDEPAPGVYDTSTVTAAWGYFADDGSPQARWRAELLDHNLVRIGQRLEGVEEDQVTFPARLRDGRDYTVRVQVQAASGLWSEWDEVAITTDFPLPATVDAAITWDRERGAAIIELSPREPEGDESEPEWVEVQRLIGELSDDESEQEWVTIADRIMPDDTISDPIPALGEANHYRVISWTSLPSSSESEPASIDIHEPSWVYINHGEGFSDVSRIIGDPEEEVNLARASATHLFKGPNPWAARFQGNARAQSLTFGGTITRDSTQLFELEELAFVDGLVCYRTPEGRRMFGGIDSVNTQRNTPVRKVSIAMTRTRYEEVARVGAVTGDDDD